MSSAHLLCKLLKIAKIQLFLDKQSETASVFFQRVKVPYARVKSEALASRKVVYREVFTEGSETAKSGTDEQKRHMRPVIRVSNLWLVTPQSKGNIQVDDAGIGGRKKLLPGEVSPDTSCRERSQQRSY
jgi:hypothetical protein